MNGNELIDALDVQPCLDTDVRVDVGGDLIEVAAVGFDRVRHTIVLHLSAGSTAESLRQLLVRPHETGLRQ
ncbi:hypothetical protein ACQP2Y_31290 [Actinoplanes sp. CA-051413]|uniref:hypothetical protein n=1 Tax=Actinoplanes sp. CA-051413 TaxID=3239899 RepID=UPI003D998AAB